LNRQESWFYCRFFYFIHSFYTVQVLKCIIRAKVHILSFPQVIMWCATDSIIIWNDGMYGTYTKKKNNIIFSNDFESGLFWDCFFFFLEQNHFPRSTNKQTKNEGAEKTFWGNCSKRFTCGWCGSTLVLDQMKMNEWLNEL